MKLFYLLKIASIIYNAKNFWKFLLKFKIIFFRENVCQVDFFYTFDFFVTTIFIFINIKIFYNSNSILWKIKYKAKSNKMFQISDIFISKHFFILLSKYNNSWLLSFVSIAQFYLKLKGLIEKKFPQKNS